LVVVLTLKLALKLVLVLVLVLVLEVGATLVGFTCRVLDFRFYGVGFSAVHKRLELSYLRKMKIPDFHRRHHHLERLFARHSHRRPQHFHFR